MEIGSIYSLTKLDKRHKSSMLSLAGEDASYFSLCREALYVLARKFRDSSKKVLIPAYTCQTVLEPFLQQGWEIDYYNVNNRLRIDIEDIKAKTAVFKPSLCIAHPYYGADLNREELDALAEIKRCGCILIEDLTQCVFSTQRNTIFDYFVGSYRKWFPIPDGAFLIGDVDGVNEMPENEIFVQTMSDAMYLRGTFHQSGDNNIKEISRRLGNIAISHISGEIVPHSMSNFSISLLSEMDIEELKRKRWDNYLYLYEHLQTNRTCIFIDRNPDELTCAPLFFPVYVKDRSTFQMKLAQQEIYAPILWPVHTDKVLINENIRQIFEEIIMLPIDQRYERSDMERMVAVINSL